MVRDHIASDSNKEKKKEKKKKKKAKQEPLYIDVHALPKIEL